MLSNGLKFFSPLSQTLQDKDATEKLLASLTEKDRDTGKTYLKIPVENEKIVEEAISAIGTLFRPPWKLDTRIAAGSKILIQPLIFSPRLILEPASVYE